MTVGNHLFRYALAAALLGAFALPAGAQSFKVQCPNGTTLHPLGARSAPNPAIKCQQISGGDGYATMADGTQTYLFAFGPLSGLNEIQAARPGTEPASIFNSLTDPNGAVGLMRDPEVAGNPIDGHVDPRAIMDVGVMNGNMPAPLMAIDEDDEFFLTLTNVGMIMRPDLFEQHTVHFHGYPNASSFYDGVPDASVAINIGGSFTYYYLAPDAGTYFWHCHITPPEHLQMGMVGQIFVRPRQNKTALGGHLYTNLQQQQADKRTACGRDAADPDILCSSPLPPSDNGTVQKTDSRVTPSGSPTLYAYNDGDGSTAYDVEYPIQIHGFDPNFHFVGMTFNPEPFVDMKDKYFLLNGRSYPDTVTSGAMQTPSADGVKRFSQPLPTIINIPVGGRALLRISDLDVTEFQTLASLGIPMHVIAINARMLRDLTGNNLAYDTNSITLGGGESLDVILDVSGTNPTGTVFAPGQTFYLYTPNLDHLSNDAENFGGLMTEVHICPASTPRVNISTKQCTA